MSTMTPLQIQSLVLILQIFRSANEEGKAILPDATPRERLIHFYHEGMKINQLFTGGEDIDPEQAIDEVVAIATQFIMSDEVPEEHHEHLAWVVNNLSKYEVS